MIKLKYIIALKFVLIFSSQVYSQSIHITGTVINEKKEAVEKVQVTLRRINEGRIITYTQTAKDGSFELKRDISSDSLELLFSCVGYAPQTHKILANNQPLLIELVVQNFALKEVVISPKSIIQRKDTISYLVSSFSAEEDRTIGDVLKKMPGVEVQESGKILYQGKELNKFYIEGSDMLGGRYGLATNNISYENVSRVEIMENHQPVKALEDVTFSDSPAMNIKLKEDAKSRWAGTMKGGSGIPGLWVAEAVAMRFKAKTQSMNTYKGNNTGSESFEMNVFFPDGDLGSMQNAGLSSYVNVSPSSAGGIGNSRSNFNQTNNLTSNNLFKVGKDFDFITEFTGSFDRRESEYSAKTTYFLGEDLISVEDKTENAYSFRKAFTGKLQLKSNQKQYYLNNTFNFNYDRNDPAIEILGTYPNSQKAKFENWTVSNNFDILRRRGEKVFTFRSNNELASKPQSLEVSKNNQTPICQDIVLSSFSSNNSMDYSFMIGKFRYNSPINLLYQYRQIENELDNVLNHLNTHKLRVNTSPSFQYNINRVRFNLSVFLYYQTISVGNQWHSLYGANPSLSMNWIASPFLTLNTALSYSNQLPNENLFYYGNILNNYRQQTAGYIDFSTGNAATFSVRAEYKDVLKAFFANAGIIYTKRRNTKISAQDFIDDYILTYYQPGNTEIEMLSVSGSVDKGISLIKGTATISPAFSRYNSNIVRNGITIPYSSDSYSLRGMVTSRAVSKCNLTYQASYSYNKNRMESNRQYFSSTRFTESFKVTYSLMKSLQMSYALEHYCNELNPDNYKHFIFSDVSVSYLPGNRWELTCGVKNIFNENRYSSFIESELASFYRSYKIRPRNILLSATYRF